MNKPNTNDWNLAIIYVSPSDSLLFLDVKLQIQPDGSILSTLFCKEMVGNTIFHAESFHPEHIKRNIPYSQYLRLKRDCTDEDDIQAKVKDLRDRLLHRGYSIKLLKKTYHRVQECDRQEILFKQKVASESMVTRLITDYTQEQDTVRLQSRDVGST